MNRPRILLVGAIAVLLLALLAACGGDDDDSTTPASGVQPPAAIATATDAPESEAEATEEEATEPSDEATSTPAEDESTEEPDDTATSDNSDDDPTATESDDEERVVGSASVEDDTDDVSNILMQEPDDPMPGIDLTNVRIEADGEQIVVTIETAGDIADQLSEDINVSFDVHLWQDNRPAYAMSLQHEGTDDWEASVTDFTVGLGGDEDSVDTEIEMSGNTLTAAFPTSMMPDLESSFEWYSSVILSEGGMMIGPNSWFDGAPQNVIALLADPDEFVEFPQ